MKKKFLKEFVKLCRKYKCVRYFQVENRLAKTNEECYSINALRLEDGETIYACEILHELRKEWSKSE